MASGGRRRDGGGGAFRNQFKRKLVRTAGEELDAKFGFDLFSEGDKRLGWLLTFTSSSWEDKETNRSYSCVDLYFVSQDGTSFKSKYKFAPYFYAATKENMEMEVEAYLKRRYEGQICDIEIVNKEDLALKNHLSGLHKSYLKISFETVQQLMPVRNDLLHVVEKNKAKTDASEAYESVFTGKSRHKLQDYIDLIVDLREYDVPYHVRFAVDNDIRCGQWYDVSVSSSGVVLEKREDLLQRAEIHICAFDIETTKLPLKFPDAEYDQVMMISYMVDGQGFLIINRECVGEDIENLEYTPKPEFTGHFKVTNVKDEEKLIRQWFNHMKVMKPGIYVSYNGDFFDWPFLEKRAAHYGMKMSEELGFQCDKNQGECRSKCACHMDCFAWVKRDSYLPQGSHGLKAVTKHKLGYDPLEVNPEDMVRFAKEQPQTMASYSVSDAVATYYLYMTYVHPFIFSLATIIPMPPDEVLRKGSGTLCEMLLMVQAFKANVICPNKHQDDPEKFYNNHLLESETYIGGHVECLESGVFRSDLPIKFHLDPNAYKQLVENLDRDLHYAIRVDGKMDLNSVVNYDDIKNAIMEKLLKLHDEPTREECPLIYHLDVAAMYPNIILTNRLQPPSVVTDEICTACDFNRPGKTCLRKLEWVWRGEIFMAKKSDYYHLKKQLESEPVDHTEGQISKTFLDLPKTEQLIKLKERLKKYCQKAYKRVLDKPVTEVREAGICMRENSFYVDTVRSFRDRRYEYKGLNKVWKGKLAEAKAHGNLIKVQEAQDMVVLYDSLQLAHKCILNSFYGYVMRKGARWYSMEMAGVVTYTGAKIIQNARLLVEKIGRPLELDTDGIWCALPGSFPETFTFKTKDPKKKLTLSYPCVMLNVDVARNNTNNQYQILKDPVTKEYTTHSECSIEFEVDGPYKAMILPASKAEGILIKKRYAVFNDDGTLAELKGFEIKRRGELKLIKVFQAEVFGKFLCGNTLAECYSAVALVANCWLDLIDNQGIDIADSELLDYISESSTMSKSLSDYGDKKSCAVTTARRLADFLGDTMIKEKGLRCQYIVACEPKGTPVSERAVPVAIFETDAEVARFYIRKWCKTFSNVDIRSIIDWSYYKQRLSSAIQKIITIPAAMQKIANPVPRVAHPDWLHRKVREKDDKFRQRKLIEMFSSANRDSEENNGKGLSVNHPLDEMDIEDVITSEKRSSNGLKPISLRFEVSKELQSCKNFHAGAKSAENIDRNVDYQGWLEAKKRKWRNYREERKRQRLGDLNRLSDTTVNVFRNHMPNRLGKDVSSYFRSRELALRQSHWQVLQLVPSTQLGQYWAWIVAEGIMLKVPITVPRAFYLNTKAPLNEEFPGRRVNKILPHSQPCFSLIEVVTDEAQFIAESRKLAAHLADPEVEGIYETKIPLHYNAILQIGCVCKVDKSVKQHNVQDGVSVSDLQMKTTTECSYMEQAPFFYFYNSASDGRAVYVLYLSTPGIISVVVVSPFQNKELTSSLLEKQFREACRASSMGNALQDRGISFKVAYVDIFKDAEKLLHKTLSDHRQQHHGPTVGVIECPNDQAMKSSVHVLNEFPCVSIPSNARDSHYQALGWQVMAAKNGLQRCAASAQWLNERISLSRYAHVPLGNFELDWVIFTFDVFYSRALRDNQQVLWISEDGIPDIGGTAEEDTCFADEVHQPVLTYPGAYRNVTIELKIHHLAINSLLKSSQVNEVEGGDMFGVDKGSNCGEHGFDETLSCGRAFRVLKQLVNRCISDAISSGNEFADALLQHVYRWLCSPKSKLHDPTLHRILHKVMQKVFALLLAELRKLGAIIVFADFSKIIIDTGKNNISTAKAYCECLLKTLQTRDLFEWIELEPLNFWQSLLYMDQYNFGGIRSIGSDGNAENKAQVELISSWNIAEYLPKAIQGHFIEIVSQFLYLPWKFSQEQAAAGEALRDVKSCTPSITVSAAQQNAAFVVTYLKNKVNSDFSSKLLRIVEDILHHFKHKNAVNEEHTDGVFPPNFPMPTEDVALEFIKHVCAVLALDHNVHHDILVMRKNLLKLVRVREFAPESEFKNPSLSFILPNVICSYCNDCRDLDLCRDPSVSGEWRCAVPQCGQPYNREEMENSLLQIVRQRERLYHLQDLICLRCHSVKQAHLAEQCDCAGAFCCKEDASEFLKKMQVFSYIAKRQRFQLLHECTSWILQTSLVQT